MLSSPPPLKGQHNPHTQTADYDMTSPLDPTGSNYPCKGYNKLLNTAEGASVASWPAGSSQKFSVTGGASHGGGSCQASLSYDGGKTFNAIKSYIGNCPTSAGGTFPFTVPAGAPSSKNALFAWTWFNNMGNREMYMNCAVVSITGGKGKDLSSLPKIFTANIGNGCSTTESTDVEFPDPGKDVVNDSKKTSPPVGASCGKAASGSTGDSSSSAQGGQSTAAAAPSAPAAATRSAPGGDASQGMGGSPAATAPAASGNNGMWNPSLYGGAGDSGAQATSQAAGNDGMWNPSLYGGPGYGGSGGAQATSQPVNPAGYFATGQSATTLKRIVRRSVSSNLTSSTCLHHSKPSEKLGKPSKFVHGEHNYSSTLRSRSTPSALSSV
ncbi:MAG: hypothetical protein M4579_001722 [Chaenotheca gracillima]|nr:MAG: hypothetical protein M4579_001722 [Chaenotheca gracillima]